MKIKALINSVVVALILSSCGAPGTNSEAVDETAVTAVKSDAATSSSGEAIINEEAPLAINSEDTKIEWGGCPPVFPGPCEIAVLHGNPAQPNADVFLRVPGGYEIPAHWHTSAERMVLVSGELQVKYQGADETTLARGDYAYGPAKLPHRATCLGEQSCTLFIAFEGAVDAEPFNGELD